MFYDVYSKLCNEKGVSKSKAAESVGLNRTSVIKWKNGSSPNGETLQKFAEYFDVSLDYLMGKTETEKEMPTLTKKDERDIAKKLNETLDMLQNSSDGLMFDGEPLDEETKELLRASLQNQFEMTKKLAKKKFTPKKYR